MIKFTIDLIFKFWLSWLNKHSIIFMFVAIVIIICGICFVVPVITSEYIEFYCLKAQPKYDSSTIEMFGNMFGGINTLFTGLAFGGAILAILLQIKEKKFEKREERNKTEKSIIDKLTYLQAILKKCESNNTELKKVIDNYLWEEKFDTIYSKELEYYFGDYYHNIICEKISQEEYYLVYKQKIPDDKILDVFQAVSNSRVIHNNYNKKMESLHKYLVEKYDILLESKRKVDSMRTNKYAHYSNVQKTLDTNSSANSLVKLDITYNKYSLLATSESNIPDELIDEMRKFNKCYEKTLAHFNYEKKSLQDEYSENLSTLNSEINSLIKDINQVVKLGQ
jgi:hypothetical protein